MYIEVRRFRLHNLNSASGHWLKVTDIPAGLLKTLPSPLRIAYFATLIKILYLHMRYILKTLALVAALCASAELIAQPFDTLRRKEADGWEFIQVHGNGTILDEGYARNGVREGAWNSYWDNGFPHYITTYRAGARTGLHLIIGRDGSTEVLEYYQNNKLEGPRRIYTRGSMIQEEAYYSDGIKHGRYTAWYPNGRKKEESLFANDRKDGKSVWYFENGNKAAEYTYRNGIIDGEVSAYHENGKVSEYGLYRNGEQTGLWKEFYPSGALKAEGQYVKGQKEGPWKEYADGSQTARTVRYKNGEPR
jgi:antitoxin component YwqK of YwqJK toxin-antitoxin module